MSKVRHYEGAQVNLKFRFKKNKDRDNSGSMVAMNFHPDHLFCFQGRCWFSCAAKVLALTGIDTQDWAELSWKSLTTTDQNQGSCCQWVNLKGSLDSTDLHPLLGNHSFLRMKKQCFCAFPSHSVNISQNPQAFNYISYNLNNSLIGQWSK